jgi:LAO/AO transport system kinase
MSNHPHNPSGINPDFALHRKKEKDISYYLEGLSKGDRFILSEAITLIESANKSKRNLALKILESVGSNFNSIRVGITGSPGVGKSTFIEAFGLYLIEQGHKVAVLAIDPSSQINKGSILGDKTRMQDLSSHPDAYIRPSATGFVLGGIAASTKEAINLCEASGFDFIIVETVGVGQSEIEVNFISDVNILLLQPGAGDDLQGIKRGVVENADIFVINKADGAQIELANQTMLSYKNAIQLFHHEVQEWRCPILLTSALFKTGLDSVFQSIIEYKKILLALNLFEFRRKQQEIRWFEKQTDIILKQIIFENITINQAFENRSEKVLSNEISTSLALNEMEKTLRSVIKK